MASRSMSLPTRLCSRPGWPNFASKSPFQAWTPRTRPAFCAPSRPASFTTRRSEEHTSELQSLRHLVCRLLLEKKITIGIKDDVTFTSLDYDPEYHTEDPASVFFFLYGRGPEGSPFSPKSPFYI